MRKPTCAIVCLFLLRIFGFVDCSAGQTTLPSIPTLSTQDQILRLNVNYTIVYGKCSALNVDSSLFDVQDFKPEVPPFIVHGRYAADLSKSLEYLEENEQDKTGLMAERSIFDGMNGVYVYRGSRSAGSAHDWIADIAAGPPLRLRVGQQIHWRPPESISVGFQRSSLKDLARALDVSTSEKCVWAGVMCQKVSGVWHRRELSLNQEVRTVDRIISLLFDTGRGVPIRCAYYGGAGRVPNYIEEFSDFRDVGNGVFVPFATRIYAEGDFIEVTVSDWKVNADADVPPMMVMEPGTCVHDEIKHIDYQIGPNEKDIDRQLQSQISDVRNADPSRVGRDSGSGAASVDHTTTYGRFIAGFAIAIGSALLIYLFAGRLRGK